MPRLTRFLILALAPVAGAQAQIPERANKETIHDLVSAVHAMWTPGTISGIYSEKASYSGMPGIGHHKYPTIAEGGDLVVAVAGLRLKSPQPTVVALLDASAVIAKNAGVWPPTVAAWRQLLSDVPSLVLRELKTRPEALLRVRGVPAGTRVIIITGFEGVIGTAAPPPSQALVANFSQLRSDIARLVPDRDMQR